MQCHATIVVALAEDVMQRHARVLGYNVHSLERRTMEWRVAVRKVIATRGVLVAATPPTVTPSTELSLRNDVFATSKRELDLTFCEGSRLAR